MEWNSDAEREGGGVEKGGDMCTCEYGGGGYLTMEALGLDPIECTE